MAEQQRSVLTLSQSFPVLQGALLPLPVDQQQFTRSFTNHCSSLFATTNYCHMWKIVPVPYSGVLLKGTDLYVPFLIYLTILCIEHLISSGQLPNQDLSEVVAMAAARCRSGGFMVLPSFVCFSPPARTIVQSQLSEDVPFSRQYNSILCSFVLLWSIYFGHLLHLAVLFIFSL